MVQSFKNHMPNLHKFRKPVENQKKWNSMGYICPKNSFLQLKHYMQRTCVTLLSTICVKIHQIPYVIFETISHFFTTQLVWISLAQTLHTFDKNIRSKCKFSEFSLLELKFIKFLMSFFKQKVCFSSKFASLSSVLIDNSLIIFHLKLYMRLMKSTHQVQIVRVSTARIKIDQIPCHFSSHKSVFA